eukprot:445973_1
MSEHWIHLKSSPGKIYSKPFLLNNHEFITVPRSIQSSDKLLKYNCCTNEWNTWMTFDTPDESEFIHTFYSAVAFDKDNKTIYLFYDGELLILTPKNEFEMSITTIEHPINFGQEATAIFIHNQLHIIGGDCNGNHYIYNIKEQTFDTIYSFLDYNEGFSCHQLVYLQTQNTMLLMGGYDDTNGMGGPLKEIWKFSFDTIEWKRLDIQLHLLSY